VAVLLLALWVRSYWWYDSVVVPKPQLDLYSQLGLFTAYHNDDSNPTRHWTRITYDVDVLTKSGRHWTPRYLYYFSYRPALIVPHWFLLIAPLTMAAIPSLSSCSSRFSLRTLLIATTLVAVGLGLIVWAARAR
jgi:hypothetical protein